MTFDSLVKESIQVLIEACAFADGKCDQCCQELRDFCSCEKLIDYHTDKE